MAIQVYSDEEARKLKAEEASKRSRIPAHIKQAAMKAPLGDSKVFKKGEVTLPAFTGLSGWLPEAIEKRDKAIAEHLAQIAPPHLAPSRETYASLMQKLLKQENVQLCEHCYVKPAVTKRAKLCMDCYAPNAQGDWQPKHVAKTPPPFVPSVSDFDLLPDI